MPIRLAILGLDPVQHEWLNAVEEARDKGEIELVGVGHRSLSLAKDVAEHFKSARPPAFDDLRLLLKDTAPQVILLDRPSNVGIDFMRACATQDIGILSLGPPVENVAEAQELAEVLEERTRLLYVWPRLADSFAYRHCMQGEVTLHPIRFAAATWMGMNHALAKTAAPHFTDHISVRSLSVLAWDAIATLIDLFDIPTTVYASIRGTVGSGDLFSDISGACSLTLRFPGDGVASVTLCDRIPGPSRREMLLLGQGGNIKLEPDHYEFRDTDGKLIDSGRASDTVQHGSKGTGAVAIDTLREFLHQFSQPSSPARGWSHRLQDIAATMEALVVSHRTGQAESPEKFRRLPLKIALAKN